MREALEGSQAIARAVALCDPDVIAAYPITPQTHIVENQRRIEEMQQLQLRMEQALSKWQDMPDSTPDGNSICHLIESMSEPE